jgi:hypothetical protein
MTFGNEDVISRNEGYYTIRTDSILTILDQGSTDVFIPRVTTPEATSFPPSEPVRWSQADYLRIAEGFSEFVWKESLESWKLNMMLFRLDCEDVSNGPQRAYFTFFKIIQTGEHESRVTREIWIEPFQNSVSWHEIELSPNLYRQHSIELAEIKITVQAALHIAEQNGGNEVRSAVENACVIFLTLAPGSIYDGWQVGYSGKGPTDLFTIHIEPVTGNFAIVHPKKK